MRRKILIGCAIVTICIIYLIYTNFLIIYKSYLQTFKRDGVVEHRNTKGQLDGEIISFKHGLVEKTTHFSNGLKEGNMIEFYETGKIKHETFFKNDIADGDEYFYYPNGKLNYHGKLFYGKRYGDLNWYNPLGKLDSYASFDIKGNSFCLFEYDESEKIKKMGGLVVSPLLFSINNQNHTIVFLEFKVPFHHIKDLYFTEGMPPGLHQNISVIINDKVYDNLQAKNNTILIKDAFPSNGLYQILIKSRLTDSMHHNINGINIQNTLIKQ